MDCVFCLSLQPPSLSFFFFFNDTATTEIYTLSLHDALPISSPCILLIARDLRLYSGLGNNLNDNSSRSEEHTSELQSPDHLVCRLLLEKKKTSSYTGKTKNSTHAKLRHRGHETGRLLASQ